MASLLMAIFFLQNVASLSVQILVSHAIPHKKEKELLKEMVDSRARVGQVQGTR